MKVSIIVLCWNHCKDLTVPFVKNFLETVNFEKEECELILLNNGSNDETKEYLEELKDTKGIKVLHSTSNKGFGGGNNYCLKSATGEYVLFLNNDVVLEESGWVTKLYNETKKGKYIVGAMLVKDNSATEFRNQIRPYLNGWCVMYPKSFLDKHGGFHKDFGWAYFEDVELSQRAIRYGYQLKQVDFKIIHLGSKSSDQFDRAEQFTFNRQVYLNLMYQYERKDKMRIVFHCPGNYPFLDEDYEGRGVGGAEASLILLSRELAKLGHVVDIYNNTTRQGTFNGVNYINLANFSTDDYCDVYVLFRNSYFAVDFVNSPLKIFWSCDQQTTNDWETHIIPHVHKTFTISEYHKKYLLSHYPFNETDIEVVDLGIKPGDYEEVEEKVPGKMIFCSVPKRGLEYLKDLYLAIQKEVSSVSLVITSDYRLWGAGPLNEEFVSQFTGIPGVSFLGKVSREELLKHQKESMVMAYPCTYDENFCISAIECIAAGAVPVTTAIGAMVTTVGESGKLIYKHPNHSGYKEEFVPEVVRLLTDQGYYKEKSEAGRKRALGFYSWNYLAEKQWETRLCAMLKEKMEDILPDKCIKCGKIFENAYEMFRHRNKEHHVVRDSNIGKTVPELDVEIKTKSVVQVSVNSKSWEGKTIVVPQTQAGDIVRILTEAYGSGIIESAKTLYPEPLTTQPS